MQILGTIKKHFPWICWIMETEIAQNESFTFTHYLLRRHMLMFFKLQIGLTTQMEFTFILQITKQMGCINYLFS